VQCCFWDSIILCADSAICWCACPRRSVKNFADEFKKRNQPLHVLMNNGGDFSPPDAMTEDGFEYLTGVNYMVRWLATSGFELSKGSLEWCIEHGNETLAYTCC
jgi:NAD(P)-dependent dehydrogenase (short-subunit alcohol dehydrogenase family)